MRLKFYLMGLGIGVIVAAVIMGIAMRGRTREMTDEEIMARARQLGMVEAGTLAEMTSGENNQNADPNRETVAQQKPQETASAQATEAASNSGETADEGSSAGADDTSGTQDGENKNAADGPDRTASDQSLVVEGEPVDDEAQTDEAAEADNRAGTTGGENTSAREQNRQNSSTVASAGSGASVTRTGAASPDNTQATGSIVVTIPDGLYSEDIASLLETAGVVDNAAAFNDYLVNSGMDRYITVGARLIPRGSSYEDVARIITGR